MEPAMKPTRIALVGDFNTGVLAHRAINESVALHNSASNRAIESTWLGTEKIVPGDETQFRAFHGVWCVPASPYKNTDGAFWAIQFARTNSIPFLGTCGGFQHALLEFARNVHGFSDADHQELQPETSLPLIHRMSCALVEKSQTVIPTGRGKFAAVYGSAAPEGYHCSFGLNPAYEKIFQNGPLEIAARSEEGEARAFELRGHPFFIGTAFQPERRALSGEVHPVVEAFFAAAHTRAMDERSSVA
jgi:CTP synthase (UTP-ammonia lyase)